MGCGSFDFGFVISDFGLKRPDDPNSGCGLRVAGCGILRIEELRMIRLRRIELRNSFDFNKLFNDGAKRLP